MEELEKIKLLQDDSCHWYRVPMERVVEFTEDLENESMIDSGDFDTKWRQYMTGGGPNS